MFLVWKKRRKKAKEKLLIDLGCVVIENKSKFFFLRKAKKKIYSYNDYAGEGGDQVGVRGKLWEN